MEGDHIDSPTIDEAGADGIWSRTIKNRCKMHDTVLKQCLKWLEMHGHMRSFPDPVLSLSQALHRSGTTSTEK